MSSPNKKNSLNSSIDKGKLQITLLKFGGEWILHPKVSKFGFYPLYFKSFWILLPKVSEFGSVKSIQLKL